LKELLFVVSCNYPTEGHHKKKKRYSSEVENNYRHSIRSYWGWKAVRQEL
jgi:hypothetical protein